MSNWAVRPPIYPEQPKFPHCPRMSKPKNKVSPLIRQVHPGYNQPGGADIHPVGFATVYWTP